MRRARLSIASLDAPVQGGEEGSGGDRDATALGSYLADPGQGGEPHTEAVDSAARAELRRRLSELSGIERLVLTRRYGLDGGQTSTLSELGGELGITREAARQYQKKAERRLKTVLLGRASP